MGASAWGLEAGGELFLTVAAVSTAILEDREEWRREAQQEPLVPTEAGQGQRQVQKAAWAKHGWGQGTAF